jgi:hypothetical protein
MEGRQKPMVAYTLRVAGSIGLAQGMVVAQAGAVVAMGEKGGHRRAKSFED